MIYYDLSAFVITDVRPRVISHFLSEKKIQAQPLFCAINVFFFHSSDPVSSSVSLEGASQCLITNELPWCSIVLCSFQSFSKETIHLTLIRTKVLMSSLCLWLESESLFLCCGGRSYGQWCYVATPGLPGVFVVLVGQMMLGMMAMEGGMVGRRSLQLG